MAEKNKKAIKKNIGNNIISTKKSTKKPSIKNNKATNWIVSQVLNYNSSYSYLGNKFSDCWELRIGMDTMYMIQRMNTEAQSAKDLIVKMVGKKWMLFTKNKKVYEDKKRERKILNLFKDPHTNSFKCFRDKYYTNSFCSGMVNCFIATMWDWSNRIQVLDSRKVVKILDDFWNVKWFKYGWKDLPLEKTYWQVTKYDPDNQNYWMSVYESIIFDAMSDYEASKRNYYFFKNNAMPSVILTMEEDIENPDEVTEAIKRFEDKYKGSEKSHWILASGWIKEVRTIDFTNKDLELLELKKFAIKKMGVVFWFDPRFLWYRDWENGSHSEYQLMASQSDKSMTSFADILEEFMFDIVVKIYPDFNYDSIQLVNDQFLDATAKQEMILKKLEKWTITIAQAIKELWYTTDNLPEYLNNYFLNIQRDTVPNIIEKSQSVIEQIKKTTEETGMDTENNIDTSYEDENWETVGEKQ